MDALNRTYYEHGCYYGSGMDALNRTYYEHGCYYGSGMDALMERPTNTDVIMAPAWMLLIKRTRNMDVIMVPAWMLLIERPTNTDVIMAPAWMLLIERTTNTDVFMPSASASAMRAEGFTPCVVAAAFLSPRQVPKCCSCHAGQSRRAWARTHFLRVYGPSEPQTRSPRIKGHYSISLQNARLTCMGMELSLPWPRLAVYSKNLA